jgi:DNA-binding GntR family transcriptional regulator
LKLQPIVREDSTKDRVYKQIKEAILCGEISSEDVFSETKLAQLLKTSRTPVREAVCDLLKEGLIVSVPRKGLQVKTITSLEQEQICLLRRSLEIEVIKKIASSITKEQIWILKEINNQQVECMKFNDNLKFIDLDQQFHACLMEFLNYNLVAQVLLNLHDLTRLIGLKALKKFGRMEEVLKEHHKIVGALESNDEKKAADYMDEHLRRTWESLENNSGFRKVLVE